MSKELKHLGEMYQLKRKELNLSLKEVENATSIRMAYLEAIEGAKGEQFLSPVYVVGFIKQYATFLGINPDVLISQYPEAFQTKPLVQEFSYGIGTLETRGAPKGSGKLMLRTRIFYTLLTVGMLTLAYYFAKFMGVF